MNIRKSLSMLCSKLYWCINRQWQRNIQVCVVGAASDIGSNVSMLLKQNDNISTLHLYDEDDRINGIGVELNLLPGKPTVVTFQGDTFLPSAVRFSHIILMVSRKPRKIGGSRNEMLTSNAPSILKLCQTVSYQNPDAFLAISTNPINSIIPLASTLLFKYNAYNPTKVFGITHLDTLRAKTLTGKALNVNPRHLHIPVIGGHSEDTIVPLFSNLTPSHHIVDSYLSVTLTKLIKRAGTDILNAKQGKNTSVLTMALAINDFMEQLIHALCNRTSVIVNSYTANSNFGTRFFSGPVKVGPHGIIHTSSNFSLNEFETNAFNLALPKINEDVCLGENHAKVMENARNYY